MSDKFIEQKKKEYINTLSKWQTTFKEVSKKIDSFLYEPATLAKIQEIQYIIDEFLHINNIPIKVIVHLTKDSSIQIFGLTLIDQIVLETIQDENWG
jgi:hypothetical protein